VGNHSCLFNRVGARHSVIAVDIMKTDIHCQNCDMISCNIFYFGTVMCVGDTECLILKIPAIYSKDEYP